MPTRKHELTSFLSACTIFTYYLTAFLIYVKDFHNCKLDREELGLSAYDYRANLLKTFLEGFAQYRVLLSREIKLFERKVADLDVVLQHYPKSQESSERDSNQTNACPPLELFLRCVLTEEYLAEDTTERRGTEVEKEMKPLGKY